MKRPDDTVPIDLFARPDVVASIVVCAPHGGEPYALVEASSRVSARTLATALRELADGLDATAANP